MHIHATTRLIGVGICGLMGLLTSFIAYSLRGKTSWIAVPASLIPGVIVLVYTFVSRSWVYFLGSLYVLSFVMTEYLYSRFVVATVNNDLGVSTPTLALFLVLILDIGSIELTRLHAFYLAVFQAYIAVLGIVFMFGVFILQTHELVNAPQLKNALAGFSSFYLLVIFLSLIGLLVTRANVDLSHEFLIRSKIDFSMTTLSGGLFFFSLCLVLSSIAYLLVLLLLFLKQS